MGDWDVALVSTAQARCRARDAAARHTKVSALCSGRRLSFLLPRQ